MFLKPKHVPLWRWWIHQISCFFKYWLPAEWYWSQPHRYDGGLYWRPCHGERAKPRTMPGE